MNRLILAGRFDPSIFELLVERSDIVVEQYDDPTEKLLIDTIPGAAAIVLRTTHFSAEVCRVADSLKVISRHGVGYDNVDISAATRAGIPVAVVGEANSTAVAEHAFALLLALSKDMRRMDQCVRENRYMQRNTMSAMEIAGKTILLVGFGRIGTRMAKRCKAFDMDIVVADPNVPERVVRGQGYEYFSEYREALDRADIISLHMPGNSDGRAEFTDKEFLRVKENAILINTARGTLVDEGALFRALTSGKLRAAGLDVTRGEPPAASLPLLKLENVIFSPHIAGVTKETFQSMGLQAVRNCLDAIDGTLNPYFIVNPEVL